MQTAKEITKLIKQGKVIVCPTDTVYGLIADAANKKAVEKIFKIKKRSLKKPVPIFVKNINQAKKLAKINKNQEKFLKVAWPGKVTVVLERKKSKIYGVDKKTIALRIPKYRLVNAILKEANLPLIGTSANVSNNPSQTQIKKVISQLKKQKHQPDLIVDAGDLKPSKPSTVINLIAPEPVILR